MNKENPIKTQVKKEKEKQVENHVQRTDFQVWSFPSTCLKKSHKNTQYFGEMWGFRSHKTKRSKVRGPFFFLDTEKSKALTQIQDMVTAYGSKNFVAWRSLGSPAKFEAGRPLCPRSVNSFFSKRDVKHCKVGFVVCSQLVCATWFQIYVGWRRPWDLF